ncbi:MAG: hypothetical protein U0869_21300 [Chloroflexota bacterium]
MRPQIPSDILSLGHARAAARRNHDFREADRLRAEIEAAGYRVVDRGRDFALFPAHPDDVVEEDGRVRAGWSGAVPSALDDPATGLATLVIVAQRDPAPVRRTLAGLRTHAPAGTHIVIVAAPDPDLEAALTPDDLLAPVAGEAPEVVWTAVPLRPVAARNAGGRRARADVVAWLQPGAEVTGDIVTPVVAALADPTVGVAGAIGLHGTDIRHLDAGPAGDAVAIDRTLLAFRRDDLRAIGPIDEHFFGDEQADVWWSLLLRDGPPEPEPDAADADTGPDADGDDEADAWAPRRALALDLPIDPVPAVALEAEPVDPAEAARRRKRDLYRVIDGSTGRPDLLAVPSPA